MPPDPQPRRRTPHRLALSASSVACLAALAALGCSSEITLATVDGRVTQNGQPLADHWVRFTPVGGGRSGNGRTDRDGRYKLAYSYRDKGARVGPNRVQVGTGGQTDDRGNELSLPQEVYATEVVVDDGANTIDIEVPAN